MKISKYILGSFLAITASASFTSCSDSFLDEEYKSGYQSPYLETEQGVFDLATSLYANLRFWFAYEWAHATTQIGVDEFSIGTDNSNETWNIYDSRLGPSVVTQNGNTAAAETIWDQMYYGISSANKVIANADIITDTEKHNMVLGEGYFLRGYNYYRLCAQYGSVVLITEPTEGVVRSFTRSSEEECLKQVISDLQQAYNLLPEKSIETYRGKLGWDKYAAAHFLAKALMLRVSERNDSWNAAYKAEDLTNIITLCDDVIGSHHQLAGDYRDLWNWTGTDCATETLSEWLLVAQFNKDAAADGRFGNRIYSNFNPQFSNGVFGTWIQRGQWVGLDFQRCRPTEYNYMCFDKVNDSRFWKSFRTIFNANRNLGTSQLSKPDNTPKNDKDNPKYVVANAGDPVIMFIPNGVKGARIHYSDDWDQYNFGLAGSSTFQYNGKDVPNAILQYTKDGKWNTYLDRSEEESKWVTYPDNVFCGLCKTEDGTRDDDKNDYSSRDGVLARVGETYLLKAEALVRQGKYQEAINVVNILRGRAAYKAGEDRTLHTDGNQAFENNVQYDQYKEQYKAYSKTNTYILSTGVSDFSHATDLQIASYTQLPEEDELILSKLNGVKGYNCSGDYERMLNFIMNERTRELDGEWVRWEDLARTKLLIPRAYAFNQEVAKSGTLDEHHLLRPIPQSFIDGLVNDDGSPLSQEQKDALQNPGY